MRNAFRILQFQIRRISQLPSRIATSTHSMIRRRRRCRIRSMVAANGNKAGKSNRLSRSLPCNKSWRERCAPQKGQSKPNSCR